MKRPLPVSLIFLISGILAGQYAINVIVPFFTLICLLCLFIFFLYKSAAYSIIFILMFVVGFAVTEARLARNPVLDEYAQSGRILTLYGVVLDSAETSTGGQRLILRLENVDDGEKSIKCNLKIQAVLNSEEMLSTAQYVSLSGKLELLDKPRNPGGFNEEFYLRSKGVAYKTYPSIVSTSVPVYGKLQIKNIMEFLRDRLAAIYDESLPPREAGIIKSMIIGDKTGLDTETADLYRTAGIYHILAISGLHVSIFGLIIEFIFGRFLGYRAAGIATFVVLVLYCIMTGCPVSAVRAVFMTSVIIFGRLLKRPSDLLSSTSFAAICLLIYQPFYLWDIGFQYSFTAVYGIAYLSEPIENILKSLLHFKDSREPFYIKYLVKNLPASIAATVFTTPIVAVHFFYIPVYAIIVNILIVPSVFILLSLALTTTFLGLVSIDISAALSGSVFFILKAYEAVASFFAELPLSSILVGYTPLFVAAFWYVGCATFTSKKLAGRNKAVLASVFFTAAIVSVIVKLNVPEGFIIDMLDVGQGDCTIVTLNKRTFIIDGGGSRMGGSTGARIIKPYLDFRGIDKIDAVFITHFDADHVSGIIEILDLKPVKNIFIAGVGPTEYDEEECFYRESLISIADKHKIPIETIYAGDTLTAGDIRLYCLSPSSERLYKDSNTASLVLRLEYGNISMLTTGDIDTYIEADILSREQNITSDIIKLAHHGSKYSNSKNFIEQVAPRLAIVGSGRNNTYGHPSSVVKKVLEDLDIPLYNTAEHGMIRMRSDGEEIWVSGFVK